MDQRIVDLYDAFTHGGMSRREFLDRLATLLGSSAAALALLPLLQNDYAKASTIAVDDARLVSEHVVYPSSNASIKAYLTRPRADGRYPAVLVIHENRGLNPHIEDVARRLAVEGFLALAPDLLSVAGGTPADESDARDLHARTSKADMFQAALAAIGYLKKSPGANGKVGAVGFCYGGGVVNRLAVASPQLDAAVAYYGQQPAATDVPTIHAALLLHYAGLDTRINAGIAAYEAALKANHKEFAIYIYPNVNHGFNNDTSSRYDKAASTLAWQRTLAFLKQQLG